MDRIHDMCIVLLGLLCILGMRASAQEVVAGEWFTGADPGFGQGNVLGITPGGFVTFSGGLSVALDPGFHWINVRARDDEGHWSHTQYRQVYVRPSAADHDLVSAEWFTGADPGFGQGNALGITPGGVVTYNDDIPHTLEPGMHWLFLRALNEEGHWSHTHGRMVHVRRSTPGIELVAAEWFTDEDPGHGQGEAVTFPPNDTISGVALEASFGPGELFRWMGLRAQDDLGNWSHTQMRPVFVRPEAGGLIISAEWFIGEDPGFGSANTIAIGDPTPLIEDILFEAITQGLAQGNHVLFVRVFNDRGTPSLAYPVTFTIDTGTGMDLQEQLGLTIGPNPTSNVLMLRADRPVEGMHLRLMDSAGRILHQDFFSGSLNLDLSGHAVGTYYLFLSDAEGKYTVFPVVKQ